MELDDDYLPYILAVVLLGLLYVVYRLGTWTHGEFKSRNMVFVKPSFFVGTLHPYFFGHVYLDQDADYYTEYKGHRAIGFFNFLKPCIYLFDPDVIKQVLVTNHDSFASHSEFMEEKDKQLLSGLIFTAKGTRWRQLRSAATPAFTPAKMKSFMFDVVQERSDWLVSYIQDKCNGEKEGVFTMDMKDLFMPYAVDLMGEIAFGLQENSMKNPDNELLKVVESSSDFTGMLGVKFLLATAFPALLKYFRTAVSPSYESNYFLSMAKNWREQHEKNQFQRANLIQILVESNQRALKSDEDNSEITDNEIAAAAFNFLGASFDSVGALIGNLAYFFAMYPDTQVRARQEIDEVLEGEDDGLITYEGVRRMKYLEQAVSEALRVFPPGLSVDRVCTKDFVIPASGSHPAITFKKGDTVVIPVMSLHRDPEYFENPDSFEPDRFSDENKHKIIPYTFLPFGGGTRACVAGRTVHFLVKVVLVNLLTRFTFEKTAKTPTTFRLRTHALNINTTPGFFVGIKPRIRGAK